MAKKSELLTAKCCYEHLGGTLGKRLFSRLFELGWFETDKEQPRHYQLTQLGMEEFLRLGIDPFERSN